MFTRTWFKDTFERCLRTFAATLGAFFVGDVTVINVDWSRALGLSGTATLITLLFCLGGGAAGVPGTAGFTNAIRPNPTEETAA